MRKQSRSQLRAEQSQRRRHLKRVERVTAHQLQQERRGSLRLDKDSRGYSNTNKRGPKSKDEGVITRTQASPQQLAFKAYVESGMPPNEARIEAGLPPIN